MERICRNTEGERKKRKKEKKLRRAHDRSPATPMTRRASITTTSTTAGSPRHSTSRIQTRCHKNVHCLPAIAKMTERSTAGRTSLLDSWVTVEAGNCSVTTSSIFGTHKRTEATVACRHKSETIKTKGADGGGTVGGGGVGGLPLLCSINEISFRPLNKDPIFS